MRVDGRNVSHFKKSELYRLAKDLSFKADRKIDTPTSSHWQSQIKPVKLQSNKIAK